MAWYRTGTVNVTQNSNAVIGVNTSFIANSRVGDAFLGPDGKWYEVTNIASDTAMSITPNYQSASVNGGTYAIVPVQGYTKSLTDSFNQLRLQFGDKMAALGTTGNYDLLPIIKGGTGANDAGSARTNLGLGTVARDNVVPIERGGTGQTSVAGIRTAVGIGAAGLYDIVPVERGGTGAADLPNARANLGLVPTTSNTDSNLGRLLRVGDFGLGYTTSPAIPGNDCNLITAIGTYRIDASTANRPAGTGAGWILRVESWDANAVYQYVSNGVGGGVRFYRTSKTGAWMVDYGSSNILATVGLSNGLPTGGIIERGSNVNGEYVKFTDGTLICTGSYDASAMAITAAIGSIYQAGQEVMWTYPANFGAVPMSFPIVSRNDGGVILGTMVRTRSATNMSWRLWSATAFAAGNVKDIAYLAIGRWN